MEKCVNTILIDRHLAEQEKGEKALEEFLNRTEKLFLEISDLIVAIKDIEADYPDYNLEEEIKIRLEEVL